MGQLWAQADAGELDTNESYIAKDVISSLQVTASNATVWFRSLPGWSFTIEDWNYVVGGFNMHEGSEVVAFFEYEDGEWTVPAFFPASLFA